MILTRLTGYCSTLSEIRAGRAASLGTCLSPAVSGILEKQQVFLLHDWKSPTKISLKL